MQERTRWFVDFIDELTARGGRGLDDIMRLAAQGDWRRRACALSAAGRIAAKEPWIVSLLGAARRRLPHGRARTRCAGLGGRYIRDPIANALCDRLWPVRVAAALALGECGSAHSIAVLQPLLRGSFRAERLAAAAALRCCGAQAPLVSEFLEDALPVADRLDDRATSLEFLDAVAKIHAGVIARGLQRGPRHEPIDASFMAGPPLPNHGAGLKAEIERYDGERQTAYLQTKPFSPINRAQNVRLLHSFLVASEHLDAPPRGRVLDLGGGSGWASELLGKLGYRAFTLDLSCALLRIGLTRFERERLVPRFAAADMMHLPIASGSMDAVIVMDALHHAPDLPAVLREVFRVLGSGGVFVLAEPGEGHAEQQPSRAEVLQHGVQERDIHVLETLEHGRAAGFDDVRAVPHYPPSLSMTVDQITTAMRAPADAWKVDDATATRQFAPHVMQAMFDRPILVFRKGRRVADSREPRSLRAAITPALARTGSRVRGVVRIRNEGDTVWLGGGTSLGHVHVGVHLLDADQRLIHHDFARAHLHRAVRPGESADVMMEFELPSAGVPAVLKVDLVAEGVCWFEDAGSRPATIVC